MTQRFHGKEILNHYLSLAETSLKTSLSLKSINKGGLEWLPKQDVQDLVNGLWFTIDPKVDISRIEMPKVLLMTYSIRCVYVKRILVNENVNEKKIDDARTITEFFLDNYYLSGLSLTNGQVLWSFPEGVELEPPEDAFVATVADDFVASAFSLIVQVRTRND